MRTPLLTTPTTIMAAGVSQDWYQDARFVTITLRLPPEINNSTVTPRFKGNYCAVLQDGERLLIT